MPFCIDDRKKKGKTFVMSDVSLKSNMFGAEHVWYFLRIRWPNGCSRKFFHELPGDLGPEGSVGHLSRRTIPSTISFGNKN